MRFLTLTPDGKVYHGLISLNRCKYLDLETLTESDNRAYANGVFLGNSDTSNFSWKPMGMLFENKVNYILNVSYRDTSNNYVEGFYAAASSINKMNRGDEEELVIDTKKEIERGASEIYLINPGNKSYYSGIRGWKPIITLKEM